MNAPGMPSTIEFAAARLRRALGSRGIECITATDAGLCDDDGTNDAMLFFLLDGDWLTIAIAACHVPDGLSPHDLIETVMSASSSEPFTLH